MRLYIASDIRHAKDWIELRPKLYPHIKLVSTWVDFLKNGEPKLTQELIKESWDNNIKDIILCDTLLLYVEKGDSMRGSCFEAGVAFAQGKIVHYVGEPEVIGTMGCCFEMSRTLDQAIHKMTLEAV